MKARIEVDHFAANGTRRTTIMYLDKDEAASGIDESLLTNAAETMIENAMRVLELPRADAVTLLLCVLVEQTADTDAYERESARRGLLAL